MQAMKNAWPAWHLTQGRNDSNGYLLAIVFLLLFSGVACAFAMGVLLSKNIVRMAFYLVLSLASTAGLFFWRVPTSSVRCN